MYSCLIISNTHRCLTYFLLYTTSNVHTNHKCYMYLYIRNFFFTVYFFLVCHQTDISLKSDIYKLTLDYFGHERSENHWSMSKIYKHQTHILILKHVWNHIFSLFSELFGENWKKMPTCNQKKGLNLTIYFQFGPIHSN